MTETRRLYYEDVYKKEFTATVVECREQKKGYVVILDEGAFYPEGGGQPSDVGTLGDAKVTEVHEKDGELLHYTDKALEVGARVEGEIDWARRFDLMQQHSGEHMVSGIIHEKYGYDNVGFHMGSDVITVDLNGMLDDAQLAEIEREVNERVWEDKEVVITYPDTEELKTIDYRSKKELTGQVRIVTFPVVLIDFVEMLPALILPVTVALPPTVRFPETFSPSTFTLSDTTSRRFAFLSYRI